ncbi:pyridoxamine 5'-phosphate oxidase [Aeromicrobium terrae]|uniref:Pyridoxine/pyridoxamine 5'-phosphate oxidase n=1 Tax=Aeromicrobium terrae TaxID=2498846 RepID=A0A5C8NLN8_9ACTN|nr:pyridoxamine 5'-phosphate oxidase [Aeromicrobium terrae]TXL62182.1 pyridoxamine 5'-phosphate oxidase [Aeromicrobium terrae]
MESPDLAAIRAEYADAGLDEGDAGDDPVALLGRWTTQAIEAGLHEPNAMALATATPDGAPSVRLVLLKALDADGAVFYTNYASRKGDELETNPRAAAVLLWHPLQRQVRIEGRVSRVGPAESDRYFDSRPEGARAAAIASDQSRPVESRTALEQRFAEASAEALVRPDDWGGYRIALDVMEFWQGRPNRLHDRLRYSRSDAGWTCERLQP